MNLRMYLDWSRNIADGSIIFQDNPKNYKSVFLVKTGGAS